MMTYGQARALVDRYGKRKKWQRPILPIGGSNRSMTYIAYGDYYATDKDTGEKIACPRSPFYVSPSVCESPQGHRPTFGQPSIDIVYHDTAIATVHPDDSATVRTGGWYSINTRSRIEDILGLATISGPLRRGMGDLGICHRTPHEGGPWIIEYPGGKVEFEDGMTFNSRCLPVDWTV